MLSPHLPSKAEEAEIKRKIRTLLDSISITNATLDTCATEIKQFLRSQQEEFGTLVEPLSNRDGPIMNELASIRAGLNDKKAEFMGPMDRKMDELRRSLRFQQIELASERAIISPIRRVCDDIIHEIFLWLVPQVTEVFDNPYYQYRLAAVCRKWREIALSTPVLWNCIPLFSPKGTSNIEDARSRLQTLIARAGLGEVDINWFPSAQDDQSSGVTIAASDYLLSSIPFNRWRSLRLKNPETVDPWSPATFDGRYGRFEALQFLHNIETSSSNLLVTHIASAVPPTLQHLTIDPTAHSFRQVYTSFGPSLLSLALPCINQKGFGVLDSLQELYLEHLPLSVLRLPQLRRLSLRIANLDQMEKLKTPLLESLSVESFKISHDNAYILAPTIKDLQVSANCLLDLVDFVTPNIEKLVVTKTKMTAADIAVQFKPFTEGDLECQPKTLVIAVPLSLKDILGVLEHQTEVTDLTLTFDSKVSWKQRFPGALCERHFKYPKSHSKHKSEDENVTDFKLCPNLRMLTVVLHPSQSDRKYWAQIVRKIFEVRGKPGVGTAARSRMAPDAMWKITCRWGGGDETTWTADGYCSENPEDWNGVNTDTKPRT